MLSSIRLDGSTECIVFPGALNKKLFETYVEHVLSPSLHPGDIVVMDNLHAHQSSKVVEFIQTRQAEVRFLPPYSPDLNPIEKMWSKVKEFLRTLQVRTVRTENQPVAESFGKLFLSAVGSAFQPTPWSADHRTPLFPAEEAGFCPT